MIKIDDKLCIKCGLCIDECFFGALELLDRLEINEKCTSCGKCIKVCPQKAIILKEKQKETTDIEDYKGFYIVAETQEGILKKVTYELVSEARRLADIKNEKVICLILTASIKKEMIETLKKYGCDEVVVLEHDKLKEYSTAYYTSVLTDIILKRKPGVVLFAATETGRDLAPRVASRIKTGLTADCTGLDINENGGLVQVRPTYGGSIMASIITPNNRPQMATIRPNVMQVKEIEGTRTFSILYEMPNLDGVESPVTLLSKVINEHIKKDLTEADIIVAGGYGLKNRENFKLLYILADNLGGVVAASRKAVDEGWATSDMQVGQTGKTVAPKLYIACGISGALQHTISIKNAEKIIAINIDPNAPIFRICDVAILADAVEVVKELNETIKKEAANN